MPLILGSNSVSGYTVKNSLRFNSGSSDYLSRTYGTPTNNLKYTKSFWIKRSGLSSIAKGFVFSSSTNSNTDYFYFSDSDTIVLGNAITPATTAVFRDVSAWYHCVMVFDSANATASNRLILYINNVQQTLSTTITQNSTGGNESGVNYYIGYQSVLSRYLDAYMSEIYMIDGQALTPSSFGQTDTDTGIWIPKAYTGTYGTNGFYLKFADSSALGTDSSGNGNTFTVNNLTSIDQTTDTPTNNFCTMNPLDNYYFGGTFSEGNLKVVSGSSAFTYCSSNFAVSQGKWYIEAKYDATSTANYSRFGIGHKVSTSTSDNLGDETGEAIYRPDGAIKVNNVETTSWGSTWTTGDIIGIALDLDNNKLYFSKNGTFQASGNPATNTNGISITAPSSLSTGVYFFGFSDNDGSGTSTWLYNFGNPPYSANSYTDGAGYGNFSYAVPSGYYSLCTKNLATFG
jgi:hypothetical protein